ncbi:MAG: DUF2851 family protein [Puniceicoccales bacterium]|nr:DUF2851 family protein [Puniceicoccales bacterium]
MKQPYLLAEITGPYGPVCIHERILQKIWWRGDFHQGDLKTLSGKSLKRLKPGRWNSHEGPDFIGALLEVDGELMQGDVEVHFYGDDWTNHGHDTDPAFNNVVLHVLLFPPRRVQPQQTLSGRIPETLILLPRLKEDIEDYANREALLALESREKTGWQETLLACDEAQRLPLLHAKAAERWRQKKNFALKRLESTHSWGESCHQLALETLGLKRNRAPMFALAQRHRLAEMRNTTSASLFAEQSGQWHLAGLRPPNHPLKRIQQYMNVLASHPNWPVRLLAWGEGLPSNFCTGAASTTDDTARFRKAQRLSATVKHVQTDLFDNFIGGTRLNTLVVDALLPLLAAHGVHSGICERYWYHWHLGDTPATLATALREQLPLNGTRPPIIANGLFQGLLQLSHENA